MKSLSNIRHITSLLYEAGTLRKTARSHRQALLTNDLSDNIAAHSFRCALIGWFLADLEKSKSDLVVKMCLLHDLSETRTGDQNWVHKRYVRTLDDKIISDQFKNDYSQEQYAVATNYHSRQSIESFIAKDADLLDQMFLLSEYTQQGNKEAKRWLLDKRNIERMHTESAKLIAREILKQSPNCWWSGLWTPDRLK